MTNDPGIRDRSVVTSSVSPSAKYSCSGSRAVFANGSTTIESRGGSARIIGSTSDVTSVLGEVTRVPVAFTASGATWGQIIQRAVAHTMPIAAAYQCQCFFGITEEDGLLG